MSVSDLSERVNRLLKYNPDTGEFKWNPSNNGRVGKKAGSLQSNGYIIITLQKRKYLAHRLAWLITHGRLPKEIDHIDRNPQNNRIDNLREVTHSENCKAWRRINV